MNGLSLRLGLGLGGGPSGGGIPASAIRDRAGATINQRDGALINVRT